MSRSHGRRATTWREHKAILQWLFILIEQSFEYMIWTLNVWNQGRAMIFTIFVNKWLSKRCTLHKSSATWSYIIYYLHMCLMTTSDHTVIETFYSELIVLYILFDRSSTETVLAVDSYVSMTPSYLCMCKFETCGEFLIYEDWRFGSELGAFVELWNCTKWPRRRIFGQLCSVVYYSQQRWSSFCNFDIVFVKYQRWKPCQLLRFNLKSNICKFHDHQYFTLHILLFGPLLCQSSKSGSFALLTNCEADQCTHCPIWVWHNLSNLTGSG